MKFNTIKCEVISVTNKKTPTISTYTLNGTPLKQKNSIKYLGIHIDHKLTFRDHIVDKVKKGNTMLNMIRRHLFFAPQSVKAKAYLTTVRPIVEYGSVCWSPSSQLLSHQLEMLNHRAAMFACDQYPRRRKYEQFSISDLLTYLGWDSLETRRKQSKLTMAFKILNDFVILDKDSLPKKHHFRPSRKCSDVLPGPDYQLEEPFARIKTCSILMSQNYGTLQLRKSKPHHPPSIHSKVISRSNNHKVGSSVNIYIFAFKYWRDMLNFSILPINLIT